MPFFRVRVEGTGISVPMGDSEAVGFFATRAVRARSEAEAVTKVRSMIQAAWTTGKYAAWSRGVAPAIRVEGVWQSPWLRNVLFKNHGHVFYPAEGAEDES